MNRDNPLCSSVSMPYPAMMANARLTTISRRDGMRNREKPGRYWMTYSYSGVNLPSASSTAPTSSRGKKSMFFLRHCPQQKKEKARGKNPM